MSAGTEDIQRPYRLEFERGGQEPLLIVALDCMQKEACLQHPRDTAGPAQQADSALGGV